MKLFENKLQYTYSVYCTSDCGFMYHLYFIRTLWYICIIYYIIMHTGGTLQNINFIQYINYNYLIHNLLLNNNESVKYFI